MGRLVAFGCSYTYGYRLSSDDTRSAKGAWPNLLGKKLGLEVENLGRPGSSNRRIWHIANNTLFHEGDIVVIMWTHHERYCIFWDGPNDNILDVGPWEKGPVSKMYLKSIYKVRDHLVNLDLYMEHLNLKLKQKGVKVYHVMALHEEIGTLKNKVADKTLYDFKVDVARDNIHPGLESHAKFAGYLKKYIMENEQ